MIPSLSTPLGQIPTFGLAAVAGITAMVVCVLIKLKKASNTIQEQNYILPKIALSGVLALIFAGIFDALAKISLNSSLQFSGASFYGGLAGAVSVMYFACKISKSKSQYSIREWFDILTQPFVLFHIFGRLGCFLGGCCYGKYTNSFLGVSFPNIPEQGIFHNGLRCYPTQLFEMFLLILILIILHFFKNKFKIYLILYSIGRFFIEFFRGDNRGNFLLVLSPAQCISIIIFSLALFSAIKEEFFKKKYS